MKRKRDRLHPAYRWSLILLWLGLGILPSLAFGIWVERQCSLPVLPIELGWPWVQLPPSIWQRLIWNASLFAMFGFFHTYLAQKSIQERLARIFGIQAIRAIYVIASGLLLFLLMGVWQNSGRIVWLFPLTHSLKVSTLSFVLFLFFISLGALSLLRLPQTSFLGFYRLFQTAQEVESEKKSALYDQWFHRLIRHPSYTFLLLAFLVTPFMSLDRLEIFLFTLLYLIWAIPKEEEKLIDAMGPTYRKYQKQVRFRLLPGIWVLIICLYFPTYKVDYAVHSNPHPQSDFRESFSSRSERLAPEWERPRL